MLDPKLIATRWDIETSSAEKIVDLYIDSLLDSLSSNDSLIYSQRELIKQDMHPYFWSAYFSLIELAADTLIFV